MTPEWAQLISSAIIGGGVLWIAFRQYRNDRERLRAEKYERKSAVYRAFADLVIEVISKGTISMEMYGRFNIRTIEAEFLLGEEVIAFLQKARTRALDLHFATSELEAGDLPDQRRKELVAKQLNLRLWFSKEGDVEATKLFKKCLRLS